MKLFSAPVLLLPSRTDSSHRQRIQYWMRAQRLTPELESEVFHATLHSPDLTIMEICKLPPTERWPFSSGIGKALIGNTTEMSGRGMNFSSA